MHCIIHDVNVETINLLYTGNILCTCIQVGLDDHEPEEADISLETAALLSKTKSILILTIKPVTVQN